MTLSEADGIRKSLVDILPMVSKRPCISLDIPTELEPLHFYISDSGHCIMAIPEQFLKDAQTGSMSDYEIPIPARYVIEKGYEIIDGFAVVDVPYDDNLGVIIDESYTDW